MEAKNNKLKTSAGKTIIMLNSIGDLINGIASRKFKYKVAKNRCDAILDNDIKILTLDQILSRLLVSLAQLKTRNNLEKLKNEIRQLLYSLHRPKNQPKQYIIIWSMLFKNGNNSKTTEPHKLRLTLPDKKINITIKTSHWLI